MRKLKLVIVFWFLVVAFHTYGQSNTEENIWGVFLREVKIKHIYSVKYNSFLPKPKFSKKIMGLDGKEITIKGFFLPLDVTGDMFVVSYYPTNMCFFCDGAGIESIIEVNVKEDQLQKFKRLKADSYIHIKGTLKLNWNDYEHLIYILNNVELIEIIK